MEQEIKEKGSRSQGFKGSSEGALARDDYNELATKGHEEAQSFFRA